MRCCGLPVSGFCETLCFINACVRHCVSIYFFVIIIFFSLCLCLTFLCVCRCARELQMLGEYLSMLSAVTTAALLSGVHRSQPCLFYRNSLRFNSCDSIHPTIQRTVGAQCEHLRRSDDILPTSQSLTVQETSTPDRSLFPVCSLFLFLYLFDR